MTKASQELTTQLEAGREHLRLLRKSSNKLRGLLIGLVEPSGITAQQYLALLWICDVEGLTQAELSAEIESDVNTVSAMIRRLETKGLLLREKHASDGRAVCLFPTSKGRQLVDEIRPRVDQLGQKLLALIPAGHEAAITQWLKATLDI